MLGYKLFSFLLLFTGVSMAHIWVNSYFSATVSIIFHFYLNPGFLFLFCWIVNYGLNNRAYNPWVQMHPYSAQVNFINHADLLRYLIFMFYLSCSLLIKTTITLILTYWCVPDMPTKVIYYY